MEANSQLASQQASAPDGPGVSAPLAAPGPNAGTSARPALSRAMTYRSVCRSLSSQRLAAYSLEDDRDSVDMLARYMWNMALCASLHPVLHAVEVSFRNAIYESGVQATATRNLNFRRIRCWLDATPTLMRPNEERDVTEALTRLDARRQTPGHLVSQLGFGFWVRLCYAPYEHGNKAGPQLWPAAANRFPGCPKTKRTRVDISRAFDRLRQIRNDIAHHQPVWDRSPETIHDFALELLGWLNPTFRDAVSRCSTFSGICSSGYAAFRMQAEQTVWVY